MAVVSMTGFGRGTTTTSARRFVVEMRSVNGRGLDVKVRWHRADSFVEAEIVRLVRAAVERGTIQVAVREEAVGPALPDMAQLKATHAALETLRTDLGLPGPVGLDVLGRFVALGGVGAAETTAEGLWAVLRPAVEAALDEMRAMRIREGAELAKDLRPRVAQLGKSAAELRRMTAGVPERMATRLRERVAVLSGQAGVEPDRLAQEIALLAERLDVSEELTRLDVHLAHATTLLDGGGAIGRKMDFLVQEIARELNTTGAKGQDAGVAHLVIEAKAELERMREMIQNVE